MVESRGSAAGYQVSVKLDPSTGTTVELQSAGAKSLDPRLIDRLLEVLRFAWARDLLPSAVHWQVAADARTTFYGQKAGIRRLALDPPIPAAAVPANDWWALVDCYLAWAMRVPTNRFTYIGKHFSDMLRCSDTGLETQGLVTSVAVEALVKSIAKKRLKQPVLSDEDKAVRAW